MSYTPPEKDIAFALQRIAQMGRLEATHGFPSYDSGLLAPILDEAGKLAADVLAPLNQAGDKQGAQLTETGVVAADGFKQAYAAYRDAGWMGLAFPEAYGGQGLPKSLALGVMEMFHAANMAFALCPMLSFGAIEALLAHGSDAQKETYLPRLISGDWTGTMNLTEPQAGSDVGALKSKAVPQEDGSFAISGQKIFITWGDHDLAENIVHLVLARLPDAPEGSRGVSLFLCPKVLVNEDGSLGERNGVRCIGLEKKLGIHASPTCVMEFSDAKAWLIGAANKGLAAMFTMMNSARLNVGLEGVAVGEAAYQAAQGYANERKQGKADGVDGPAPIIHHSDVRRMLTTMRAKVMAARSICFACGVAADLAEHAEDDSARDAAKQREDLLTPIAKAWSTDIGVEVASEGVQVHGGMGFMNETLAAQLYRDARIAPIYEGTNGIQAIDLAGRKLAVNGGQAMTDMLTDIDQTSRDARSTNHPQLVQMASRLEEASKALADATDWMRTTMAEERERGLAGATAYLKLAGDVIGGHFLIRGATHNPKGSGESDANMIALAGFYAETALANAPGALPSITSAGLFLEPIAN
ncbi:MAG: acyl-CoA dehydrogenase [Pseudomonadota bacterium]